MNLHDDFEISAAAAANFLNPAHAGQTPLPSSARGAESGGPRASQARMPINAADSAASSTGAAATPALVQWQLSLRFGADALRNAVSPLDWVRKLSRSGRVLAIHTLVDAVPALAQLDPETCCLGFEIRFESQAGPDAMAETLALQTADGEIAVLGPEASAADFQSLLERRAPDAASQAALLALWREQGLVLPLRDADPELDTADDPELAGAQDSGPQIERRAAARAAGSARPQIS